MRTLAAAFPEWLPGLLRGFQELFDVLSVSSGFILFPVEVPDSEVARVLADWLSRRGVSVTTIEPKTDADWEDLAASILRSSPPSEGGALMVIGSPQASTVRPAVIQALRLVNQRRDTIARHLKRPLLWTGPVSFLDATWNHAPDFWSVRALDQRIAPPEGGDALDSLRQILVAAREQGDVRSEARLAVQLADDLSAAGAREDAAMLLAETLFRNQSKDDRAALEKAVKQAGGILRAGMALGQDRYLIVEALGKGSIGTVWKALDRRREESVAVKVLDSLLGDDATMREPFYRGAEVMVELADAAVVRVIEPRGDDNGFSYIVMEFVSGGTLDNAVLSHRLATGHLLSIGIAIADVLARLHAKRLIHCAVMPSNILLTESVAPKLTGFDHIRDLENPTDGRRTRSAFSAPEMFDPLRAIGSSSDVYSLGLTLAVCLLGQRLPRSAIYEPEMLLQDLDCAEEVKEVLRKATARQPENRYRDAGLFGAALRQASQALLASEERAPEIVGQRERSPMAAPVIASLPSAPASADVVTPPKSEAPSDGETPPDTMRGPKKRPHPSLDPSKSSARSVIRREPKTATAPSPALGSRAGFWGFGVGLLAATMVYLTLGRNWGSTDSGAVETGSSFPVVTATVGADADASPDTAGTTSTNSGVPTASTTRRFSGRGGCPEGSIRLLPPYSRICIDTSPVKKEDYKRGFREGPPANIAVPREVEAG